MEIKIGISNVNREITLNVDLTLEQILDAYTAATADSGFLLLTDESGRQTMIPVANIGFIEFGQEHTRPVGFGTKL
ncbi:MAG: DUF3107 domain-containing protein [Propionibacteriaceae bacterium]|jgi:hypothetical protein|nr:DUF3107 domain-containing protein [Propionibacteriaceae bacterium]